MISLLSGSASMLAAGTAALMTGFWDAVDEMSASTLAALPAGDALSFTRLQDMIGLTPGNLITHLRKLEDAGYITSEKTGNGVASRTAVTPKRQRPRGTPRLHRSAARHPRRPMDASAPENRRSGPDRPVTRSDAPRAAARDLAAGHLRRTWSAFRTNLACGIRPGRRHAPSLMNPVPARQVRGSRGAPGRSRGAGALNGAVWRSSREFALYPPRC